MVVDAGKRLPRPGMTDVAQDLRRLAADPGVRIIRQRRDLREYRGRLSRALAQPPKPVQPGARMQAAAHLSP